MKLKFGKPNHGWLPVKIESMEWAVEFESSDVPEDPLYQLIDGLCKVLNSSEAEVWWHLEPAGYFFNLSRAKDKYKLDISFSMDSRADNREDIKSLTGDFDEVILPVWRGLKDFYSRKYSSPHWPDEPTVDMSALNSKIKLLREKG